MINIFVFFVLTVSTFLTGDCYELNKHHLKGELRILSRSEWNAEPQSDILTDLELPATRVIILDTSTQGCANQTSCAHITRTIQTYHMKQREWFDIGYNFLIGGDGVVYEGRGWDKQGAHTKGHNNGTIGIALIGHFTGSETDKIQIDMVKHLIKKGVENGKLSADFQMCGKKEIMKYLRPGVELYQVIPSRNLWSDVPIEGKRNEKSSTNGLENKTASGKYHFVSRNEWSALSPVHELTSLHHPISKVIIAHTETRPCFTQDVCSIRLRAIQKFHIEIRQWDDIAYNFLVGEDGTTYEGRGWDKQGAHTKGHNAESICISLIGTFFDVKPTDKQINAVKILIKEGVKIGKLAPDYLLFGHLQLTRTDSPGTEVYKIIQHWDHWSNTTDYRS